MTVELDRLRNWIGREDSNRELLTPSIVERFNATFARDFSVEDGADAPLLIHLCLGQPAVEESQLGPDGHPSRGGFLPPVSLPRRMWAGGSFDFHQPIRIGEMVERRSTVADISIKKGRSGPLCFVTVSHHLTSNGRLAVTERQDIVYRQENSGPSEEIAAPTGEHSLQIDASPLLLFRYSALTFNGHRIHYDADYARESENYPGLVVHGPLQATLLLQLAQRMTGRDPRSFEFRSRAPLFASRAIVLNAREQENGLALWTAHPDGPVAMEASAHW